jgi:hypothetical protein
MGDTFGFIILRHVNNELTDKYWKHSYDCIRKYYPENEIIIIDDNSNQAYITPKDIYKAQVIEGPYPQRGELLPYLYYAYNKPFDIAIIIHDSVFINSYIDPYVKEFEFLWDFNHVWDESIHEIPMITALSKNHPELVSFHTNLDFWKGCFGGMSIIRHEYLHKINEKYNLDILIDFVVSRVKRSAFERVLACLLQIEKCNNSQTSRFGKIHAFIPWGVTFNQMHHFMHLPIIKVWTGR